MLSVTWERAYHWLIDFDGQRAAGRLETAIGAHVGNHNRGTIGFCLIGGQGADADDKFGEHFTSAQARSLRTLIAAIRGRTQTTKVTGHNMARCPARSPMSGPRNRLP